MKKIINWSIGSFIRTIGRVLAYLFIGFILSLLATHFGFVMSVKADTTPNYWITNTDVPTYFDLFDCTESTCNRVGSSNYTNEMIELNETGGRQFTVTTRQYNLKGNGIVIRTSSNARYNVGYLYQTTFYVCSDAIMDNATYTIYPSYYGDAFTNNNVFQSSNSYNLSGLPGLAPQWENCYAFSTIFSPGENGTYINLRLKSTSRINGYYALVGFKSESLGLYSGEVKSIVQNSGFATAKSVDEVKKATDEVKEETKKTNDTLNNSDTSGAQSDAHSFFNGFDEGDTGSLMNLVKLPLKFLNSLNNSCQAIELDTGFIGKYRLECLSTTLYNQSGFSGLFNIIKLILNGVVMYGCIRKIISVVQKLKNPDDDEIEVMDL